MLQWFSDSRNSMKVLLYLGKTPKFLIHIYHSVHRGGLPPVADLGFPRGGGANSPGGAPTYDFAKFSQKLHEIERIWAPRRGAHPNFYYVDPPLPSAQNPPYRDPPDRDTPSTDI